jgi:hypothetical protein
VEGFQAAGAFFGALFPIHVQRQPLLQVLLGPDAVDALLRRSRLFCEPGLPVFGRIG